MALSPGTRLGPYEVTAQIGVGGMGQVYRARDTKLSRDVALKVLPDSFANDPDRLARFTREAQTLASLNHPNIAQIYGLEESGGVRALVMELVEGDDLSQRIARGAIPIDEALPIAKQIAEALEAAHEQGIIHRDLKPANVKVRADGTVKVLDFGLAKAMESPGAMSPSVSQAPTITTPAMMTGVGMILGTAVYMSPEQAKGRTVDRRADVWAFGAVLYEILTGRRAFGGDDVSDTLANVLKVEPDWAVLPADVPPRVRQVLRACLQKNAKQRIGDVQDIRLALEGAFETAAPQTTATATASTSRGRLPWMVATAAVLVAAALSIPAVRHLREAPLLTLPEMRVEINTPATDQPTSLALSPDGRQMAFTASGDGASRLWLRSLATNAAQPLVGTEDARYPFWSPDSGSVAFFAGGKLKRLDIEGGLVQTLADAPAGRGGTWNRDGTILFAPNQGGPIFRISDTGGEPVAVTHLELPQQASHRDPWFLPDGRHFLYYVTGSPETRGVYVGQLGGSASKRLLDADTAAVYAQSGHLLFVRQDTLFAQGFDPVRLEVSRNLYRMGEQVEVSANHALSASAVGPVAYRAASAGRGRWQFAWFDRAGREIERVGEPDSAGLENASLSPDGRRVAMTRTVDGNFDIWLLELGRGVLSRFTFGKANGMAGSNDPLWSPDGSHIAFRSNRGGAGDLYQKPVTGTASEDLLLATAQNKQPMDISPDGRYLLYRSNDPKTSSDIWALLLNGERKPFPVVQTTFDEREGKFSPDGKWIAFTSSESGRPEIYVQAFPGPGGKAQVSTNGGGQVRWQRDRKGLFYIAPDGRLMVVPLEFAVGGQSVEVGRAAPLFAPRAGTAQTYMVSPDGQRFLMNTVVEEATSPISVILNWQAPVAR